MSLAASPVSLTFAARTVGSTSPAQAVTVTNTGTGPATLGTVATTGDYAQTKTCGTTLAAGASCTVNVTFTPTATGTRTGTLSVASNDPNGPLTVGLTGTGGRRPSPTWRRAGRPPATGHAQATARQHRGRQRDSYWESNSNAFPQSVTVDLGSTQSVGRVVLDAAPGRRLGHPHPGGRRPGQHRRHHLHHVVGSAAYTFNPATGNTATITFPATSRRHLRLTFTANAGWPAGQLSEFEVFQ